MTDGTGITGWTFDKANRVTQIAQPNGTVSYGFDNANRRTGMTIAGTGTWSYVFDRANRPTSTTNPSAETTSFTLDNAGRVTRQTNGNTSLTLNSFDTANRITEIQTKTSAGTVLSDIHDAYNGVNAGECAPRSGRSAEGRSPGAEQTPTGQSRHLAMMPAIS